MQSFFSDLRHRAILAHTTFTNDASVLDTSCQEGSFLKVLLDKNSNKNLRVAGVDISEEDISKAKALIPDGKFLVADNKTLTMTDREFDVVISSLTLHHMSDGVASLSEMKRVLKDDGCIYLIDIIPKNIYLYKILNFIKCREPYHFEKFYSLSETQDLVKKVGLKIEKRTLVSVFPLSILTPITILKLYNPI